MIGVAILLAVALGLLLALVVVLGLELRRERTDQARLARVLTREGVE